VIDLSGVEMIGNDRRRWPRSTHICYLGSASELVLGQAGCSRQSHPPIAGAYQVDLRFRRSSHLGCRIVASRGHTRPDGPDSRHDASLRAEIDIFFGQMSLISGLLNAVATQARRLRSDVELPVPAQGNPLDFLFAQEEVECCGNRIGALAQLFRQIALADDYVPGWVALMDVAAIG
jgi:hypothetical protein